MKKLIKFSGAILAVLLAFTLHASAQTDCPADKVCISIQDARQALIDRDTVAAQKIELAAKDQAIADFQKELNAMRIELAKAIGEKTGAEQMNVRLTAIIDVLLKGQKKKCMPFSVCLF